MWNPRRYITRHSKKLRWLSAPLWLLVMLWGNFLGCEPEDQIWDVDCGECYSYRPDSANLIVRVTINSTYDSVPLTFYRGSFEEGEIDWQDTATTEEFYLYSEMDREYTVRAVYRSADRTIIAFDSDEMVLQDASDECGYPCYLVKGGIFDLQLLE
ncbi:MAG: hypothetical protein ACQERV_04515 [Bacteroidota bacterium]